MQLASNNTLVSAPTHRNSCEMADTMNFGPEWYVCILPRSFVLVSYCFLLNAHSTTWTATAGPLCTPVLCATVWQWYRDDIMVYTVNLVASSYQSQLVSLDDGFHGVWFYLQRPKVGACV